MKGLKTGKKQLYTPVLSLFLLLSLFWADPLFCSENYYYSIHIASFKDLKNANNYVNTMSKKGKVIFWKEADVPSKGGLFYRVYIGKYKDRKEAGEYWDVLNEQGLVSYKGIHRFEEAEPVDEDLVEDTSVVDSEEKIKSDGERFVDNQDGTITDNKTGLMWIKNGWRLDFFSAVKWQDAVKKCEKFKYAGHSDWRLPTIKEWDSILDRKKEYPALVEPNPFENIIVHMPYWSQTEYKSMGNSSRVYTVMLYYGRIGHQNTAKRAFILPVRSIK